MNSNKDIIKLIRDVPDFPKKGILFKDITPVLLNASAMQQTIDGLAELFKGQKIDKIAAMESRGFIFAVPLAMKLGVGFIPLRKPGKLPWKTVKETYSLEYGTDSLEMHEDAVNAGERILIIDDLLATGGTAQGAANLIQKRGGKVVGLGFVIELGFLKGREKLAKFDNVKSLVTYE
jgi:adenine phosphoribosyltransferase